MRVGSPVFVCILLLLCFPRLSSCTLAFLREVVEFFDESSLRQVDEAWQACSLDNEWHSIHIQKPLKTNALVELRCYRAENATHLTSLRLLRIAPTSTVQTLNLFRCENDDDESNKATGFVSGAFNERFLKCSWQLRNAKDYNSATVVSLPPPPPPPPPPSSSPPPLRSPLRTLAHLRSLFIEYSDGVSGALAAHTLPPRLESLVIRECVGVRGELDSGVLRDAPRLRHLQLSALRFDFGKAIPQNIDELVPNLRQLHLTSLPGLRGSLPPSIGHLSALQSLEILQCPIIGDFPGSLSSQAKRMSFCSLNERKSEATWCCPLHRIPNVCRSHTHAITCDAATCRDTLTLTNDSVTSRTALRVRLDTLRELREASNDALDSNWFTHYLQRSGMIRANEAIYCNEHTSNNVLRIVRPTESLIPFARGNHKAAFIERASSSSRARQSRIEATLLSKRPALVNSVIDLHFNRSAAFQDYYASRNACPTQLALRSGKDTDGACLWRALHNGFAEQIVAETAWIRALEAPLEARSARAEPDFDMSHADWREERHVARYFGGCVTPFETSALNGKGSAQRPVNVETAKRYLPKRAFDEGDEIFGVKDDLDDYEDERGSTSFNDNVNGNGKDERIDRRTHGGHATDTLEHVMRRSSGAKQVVVQEGPLLPFQALIAHPRNSQLPWYARVRIARNVFALLARLETLSVVHCAWSNEQLGVSASLHVVILDLGDTLRAHNDATDAPLFSEISCKSDADCAPKASYHCLKHTKDIIPERSCDRRAGHCAGLTAKAWVAVVCRDVEPLLQYIVDKAAADDSGAHANVVVRGGRSKQVQWPVALAANVSAALSACNVASVDARASAAHMRDTLDDILHAHDGDQLLDANLPLVRAHIRAIIDENVERGRQRCHQNVHCA